MTDQLDRQSSQLTPIREATIRPQYTAARPYTAGRREFTVIVAAGVAVSVWALFPSTVETGIYVPLPETSSAAGADSATAGNGGPVNDFALANPNQVPSAQSSKQSQYGFATVRYSSHAVDVSLVPLRSKLQALLMLVHSSGDQDSWALEAKLQALLKLPDSVLAQLMQHPDLVDLRKKLDAVFLGGSDLAGVATELDRISVTSAFVEEGEQINVKVDGKPAYIVRTTTDNNRTMNAAGTTVAAVSPSGQPVTVTVFSEFDAPAEIAAFSLALAPDSEPLPPAPAPTIEMMSFAPAPSIEPSAPPSASPTPSSSPEPTDTPQTTSNDVMTSGNKFEPGETAATEGGDNSSETQAPEPSSSPPDPEGPAETGGGDPTDPSNTEGGASSSSEGESSP
jgi:hypothetical protein